MRRSTICWAARATAPGMFRFFDSSPSSRSERPLMPRLSATPTGVLGLFNRAVTIWRFYRYFRLLAM